MSKKPVVRRQIAAIRVGDVEQGNRANQHLEEVEAQKAERFHINYPIDLITPSPKNPRRITLDEAGVTREIVTQLAIKKDESINSWDARVGAHIKTLDGKSVSVWSDLIDLTHSIINEGILQPILLTPQNMIIAGERRWTASLLAGKEHCRVIIRKFTDEQQAQIRLIENLQRSDLTIPETVLGLRSLFQLFVGPCEPDNEEITIAVVAKIASVGRTTAAHYRAFCRLPEGDPVLKAIVAGEYSSQKAAYTDASARIRQLQAGEEDAPQNEVEDTLVNELKDQPKKESSLSVTAKVNVPMNDSVGRLIGLFSKIEGLPKAVSSELAGMSEHWAKADDKKKPKVLAAALSMALAFLENSDDS